MASIQILEIRPVEEQVEDLSYDMTGSIRAHKGRFFTKGGVKAQK